MVSISRNIHNQESKVSVIVPTHSKSTSLDECVAHLPKRVELFVINDDVLLLAGKRNLGAKMATKKYLLFCDDDNNLGFRSVSRLVSFMEISPDVGVVGMLGVYRKNPKMICDGGSSRGILSGFTYDKRVNKKLYEVEKEPFEVDEVANVFMVRKQEFCDMGGMDTECFPIDLDEADLCRRMKLLGKKIMIVPTAITSHKQFTHSRIPDFRRPLNAYYMGRNRILFQKKFLTKVGLLIHAFIFFPVFVFSYIFCLLFIRRKPLMVKHFLKGVVDGLQYRFND